MYLPSFASLLLFAEVALGCDGCYGAPESDVVMTRKVRRMQPEAQDATTQPRGPLEWGQINFLHTTDTHGWLEGHLKERNYGADWGDFVSFSRLMKHYAGNLGVDLLLIDTGDLHDGAGLSDATSPNGAVSNPIFEEVDYDLLTIGNHELYVSEVAYETFNQFSKFYGEKYLTSNVEIRNPATGQFEYIGQKFRYFKTPKGLRIMSFGVLYDFTGNSNVSRITKAADLVKQQWFIDAVNYKEPIDLFVLIGHNPIRPTVSSSTFGLLYKTIRSMRPTVPITGFGGHTHIRDAVIYDSQSVALESGRYCETLGWLSQSGINSSTFTGNQKPRGVLNPTKPAIPKNSTSNSSTSSLVYSRRYLDWNRLTFAYHSKVDQQGLDLHSGERVSAEILAARKKLNLTALYGCAPRTYCQYCKPFGDPGNILTLSATALAATVINQSRASTPRLIIINSGSIRFDLVQGPFTYDDSFIVSPFKDAFQYIPNVPYNLAKTVIGTLNAGAFQKRELSSGDFSWTSSLSGQHEIEGDSCVNPPLLSRSSGGSILPRSSQPRFIRRQSTSATTPGYVTTDDFGTDGDDTPHSKIPNYPQPNDVQAKGGFPADGSDPQSVDLVFLDFIASYVINALKKVGGTYTTADVSYYLPEDFTTNSYLPAYAKLAWQQNLDNCPVGVGVGS